MVLYCPGIVVDLFSDGKVLPQLQEVSISWIWNLRSSYKKIDLQNPPNLIACVYFMLPDHL